MQERNNIITPVRLTDGTIGFVVRDRINPSRHGKAFDANGQPTKLKAASIFDAAQRKACNFSQEQIDAYLAVVATLKTITL